MRRPSFLIAGLAPLLIGVVVFVICFAPVPLQIVDLSVATH